MICVCLIKYRLVKYVGGKARAYDPSLTVDEIVAQQVAKDSRVNPEQFKKLVERWFSSDYQVQILLIYIFLKQNRN